jgi:hypothetical protein
LVAYELRRLASALAKSEIYCPHSDRAITARIAGVNLFCGFIASLVMIPVLPAEAGARSGIACLPLTYDMSSESFYWAVSTSLVFVIAGRGQGSGS